MIAATLTTERLTLRRPEAGDLMAYQTYCASSRTRFVRGPFTAAQAFEKFAAIIGHWTLRGFGRYIMEHAGEPIGHVGPSAVEDANLPEMTWSLWDGTYEGQGLASEAASAVWTHLAQDCGWRTMLIHILPQNVGSLRIAERLGAQRTDLPAPDWYPNCLTFRLSAGGDA